MTGAATTAAANSVAITVESIQRAIAEVERIPPPRREPFRLTRAEVQRLRQQLKTPEHIEAHAIFGVPVIVIDDDHPLALFDFATRDKFVLKHAPGQFA